MVKKEYFLFYGENATCHLLNPGSPRMSLLILMREYSHYAQNVTHFVTKYLHSFPSRMTIGMLIESMAGKSGALHGSFHDGTPFAFHEHQKAVDLFGEQLRTAGYEYYGSEPAWTASSNND